MKLFFVIIMSFISYAVKADTTDNYQIFIKKVLICDDAGLRSPLNKNNFLPLTKSNYEDTIDINYNHCTSGASSRRIKLISRENKIIGEWTFPDKEIERLMRLPIKQILSLKKLDSHVLLTLYYYDEQIKEGRFLMSVQAFM